MRWRGLSFFATVVALIGSAPATAQDAPAPQLALGDTWTYVVRDLFTGLAQSTNTARVESIAPQGYVLRWTDGVGSLTREETLDLNVTQKIDGVPSDTGQLNFPLKVGKKWRSVTWFEARTAGVQDIEQEVVGIERQKVPAGEFDTYRIVGKGEWVVWNDTSGAVVSDQRGRFEAIAWYAPAVKRVVARETRVFAKGHIGARTRSELERFELH